MRIQPSLALAILRFESGISGPAYVEMYYWVTSLASAASRLKATLWFPEATIHLPESGAYRKGGVCKHSRAILVKSTPLPLTARELLPAVLTPMFVSGIRRLGKCCPEHVKLPSRQANIYPLVNALPFCRATHRSLASYK